MPLIVPLVSSLVGRSSDLTRSAGTGPERCLGVCVGVRMRSRVSVEVLKCVYQSVYENVCDRVYMP